MTLTLPAFEVFEEASQIRWASKSVLSNIVEGYGRREYKNEFKKYISYAIASNDETRNHLEMRNYLNPFMKELIPPEGECTISGKHLIINTKA